MSTGEEKKKQGQKSNLQAICGTQKWLKSHTQWLSQADLLQVAFTALEHEIFLPQNKLPSLSCQEYKKCQ